MFAGGPALDGFRGLAMLYPEPVQIVALRRSGIDSIDDLEGRRVAVGARESGTEHNARQILAAHGLDYGSVQASLMPFEDAAVALRDGLIHGAFLTAGAPTPAVARLISVHQHEIVLLPVEPATAEAILGDWPFYTRLDIPAGTYASVPEAVPTLAVRAMLVARADLDPGIVSRLLEVLYRPAALTRLCRVHARGCNIVPEGARLAMPIPLHAGAEVYYGPAIAAGG
jgi:uncharacterized protein